MLDTNNDPTLGGGGVPQGAGGASEVSGQTVSLPFAPGLGSFATLMFIQSVPTPETTTVSPYGNFLDIFSNEQKLLWRKMIKPSNDHKLLDMTVASSRAIVDLFCYCWMCYMRIPTKGTGAPSTMPGSTPGGHPIFSMDLSDFKNIIKEFNHFMGDLNEPLKTCLPANMQMKYLDINVPGNAGLVGCFKVTLFFVWCGTPSKSLLHNLVQGSFCPQEGLCL